ncbi:TonB-dependent receptor [soil metagenome]
MAAMRGNFTRISNRSLFFLFFCLAILSTAVSHAQTVKGTVADAESKELIIGVAVVIKGTTVGTVTDFDGKFELDLNGRELPLTLEISYLGYTTQELIVTSANVGSNIKVSLATDAIKVQGVEITASRISEKQLEEPLTVESMNLAAIKETPSTSFYNGLGTLKGVDLTTASLGFVVINTRGFNSTRPVRTLQLVDGADNQAPGLNFSLGNFVGSSELDIQSVDLIVGASSAFYGPNAFNGVISMKTKNPFYHPGLSVLVKGGERNLFEGAIRYAKKFQNKNGVDKFAFKVNFSYLRADDWQADNLDQVQGTPAQSTNLGGYDAVNRYGDENVTESTNNFDSPLLYPGLGRLHRTGYLEKDLVNYNTRNYKLGTALHYKLTEKIELSYAFNFGAGTTVYQGDNRYSLKGLKFYQNRIEISQPDKFFVRAYHTIENAGNSYDAVFTALLLQNKSQTDLGWSQAYSGYWLGTVVDSIRHLPGYPNPNDPAFTDLWFDPNTRDSIIAIADGVLAENSDKLIRWHDTARRLADANRLEPGTAAYDSAFADIVSKNTFLQGGSKFYDKSSLSHVQGEYMFHPSIFDITVGGSFRLYTPQSQGTIFSDTSGTRIRNWEVGTYAGISTNLAANKIVLTAVGRVDKNQNFKPVVSPAASIVYKYNQNTSFRLSFSSAIRNPTLQDQYLYYNVGRAILVGNLNGFQNLVTTESYFNSFAGVSFNRDSLKYFNIAPVKPEKVKTLEIGYKGVLFKSLFVDMSYYYNWYKDFLGYNIGAQIEIDSAINYITSTQFYRVSANATDLVSTQGFAIGLTYGFGKYYALTGNYSWNRLDRRGSDDPIIPAFNTPEHKFNIGISGREVVLKLGKKTLKDWGFNFNYKWVQGFLFEGSPQFTGSIPSYGLVDGQINYNYKKWHTTFKLGATNILNNKVYQTYGGPRIGRLAYVSLLFDIGSI